MAEWIGAAEGLIDRSQEALARYVLSRRSCMPTIRRSRARAGHGQNQDRAAWTYVRDDRPRAA